MTRNDIAAASMPRMTEEVIYGIVAPDRAPDAPSCN
jgi:hypothetical protein